MSTLVASVVIPAHNEAASIAHVLGALAPLGDHIEVVVACNGCTDDTADVARTAAPWASIVELPAASKTAALQAGDDQLTTFPRLYLDGDVVVGSTDLQRLIARLTGGVEAVAPTARYETSGASRILRSHYRWWIAAQARRSTLTGSGAIVVTPTVRGRFDRWPSLLGDDYFLDGLVEPDAKMRAADVEVDVRLPARFGDCVRRRVRIRQGNREIDRAGLRRAANRGGRLVPLVAMLRGDPALVVHAPAHAVIVASAIALGTWQRWRGTQGEFYRDASRDRQTAG